MGAMTDVAVELREEFDKRAGEADLSGELPAENYTRMADRGYLRGPVPAVLGGLDADLIETAAAQRALGWGCASTALAVNMHLFQVGAAADGYRASGANEVLLRRVAEEAMVLGSTGAEAIVAGAWDTPTTATPDADGYVISGHKYFFSQSHLVDVVRVNARDTETGEILVVAVPMQTRGVSIVDTWDTLGMRATASHDLILDRVRVPADSVGVRLPAAGPAWHPAFANVIKWFLSGVSGVYLGIADRAREAAYDGLGRGSSSSHRDQALTDALVGRMEVAHLTADAAFRTGVADAAALGDPTRALAKAIATKEVVTAACVDVVDRAVDLIGGRAFHRRSVLERLVRDLRAARHHPPAAPVAEQMIGQARHQAG